MYLNENNRQWAHFFLGVCLSYILIFLFPIGFLNKPKTYSFAVYDKYGRLTGAQIASDGQWRFEKGSVPEKFEKCIIQFEDKRFYFHPGVDFISIARAFYSDIRSGEIVSGGSTITMQTVRILSGNPKRTVIQKIKECILSVILECRYSKKYILSLYCENAPFGGNVVGLEAASWRYFNRSPQSLTWAEAATLAVLPNQPALVYPGANKSILLSKRNKLLMRLHKKNIIDDETLQLSLLEPLPEKPYNLPSTTSHYLEYLKRQNPGVTKFYTEIDPEIQFNTLRIVEKWSDQFARLGINNAACLIIDTKTGNVLAYIGNTGAGLRNSGNYSVDLVQSKRSSGSLLKPFLYAAMLDNGMLLPKQLVVDIPTRIGSYKPDNNIPRYNGVVAADEALSRSLNIPAIRELREFGISAFLDYLSRAGFSTFNRTADEYGLPLILGGGELTLWETVYAYASFMNKAMDYDVKFPASTGTSYLTLEALMAGIRPEDEALWQSVSGSKKIAWKTGTSNGYRDAWCIGTTVEYTVGVWVGNAEGNGNENLTSVKTSAPLLFDIFSALPDTHWPAFPVMELDSVNICEYSGYLAGKDCEKIKKGFRPRNSGNAKVCPYCHTYSFTPDGKYLANVSDLTGIYEGTMPLLKKCFVLPPQIEYWYTKNSLNYKSLPPYVPWHVEPEKNDISIIFPEQNSKIIIPIEIDGTEGQIVMQAATRNSLGMLYWDLDGNFIAQTQGEHSVSLTPDEGFHVLTVTDENGSRRVRTFEVVPID